MATELLDDLRSVYFRLQDGWTEVASETELAQAARMLAAVLHRITEKQLERIRPGGGHP